MEQSRLPFKLLKNLIHNNGGWIKKIRSLSEDFNINTNNYTHISPRARGVLFVLKGPYDPRVPPTAKLSQESESARLTKIILSKSTVKTL